MSDGEALLAALLVVAVIIGGKWYLKKWLEWVKDNETKP